MNKSLPILIASFFMAVLLSIPALEAQQKPNPVIIWCQDGSGNYAPCQSGPTAAASADNLSNQTTSFIHSFLFMFDGSTWDRVRGDSTNGLLVNLGANNDVTVSGSVTANIGTTNGLALDATLTGRFPTAFSSADNIAAQTATFMHGGLMGWDGSTWDRIPGNSTDGLLVNLGANNDVTASQTGTWTVQPGNTANTTAWLFKLDQTSTNNDVDIASALPTGSNTIGGVNLTQYTPASGRLPVDPSGVTSPVSMATNTPVGNVAHDGVDSGAPLKVGAKATTSVSGNTMVASNDRTDLFAGIDGVQIVRPYANLEDRVSNVVGVTDGSSTSLVAAQGAGIRFCATTLVVSNSSATNVTVDIRDGTAGSVIMTIPAAANMGGAVVPLPIPICTSANTAMAMDPSASATTVTVSALGFKTKL